MKKVIAITLALVLMLVLASCGGGSKSIVGIWIPEGTADAEANVGYIFNKDGTFDCVAIIDGKPSGDSIFGEYAGMGMKYKISGDKLIISVKIIVNIDVAEYDYAMDGDVMVIDGSRYVKYNG